MPCILTIKLDVVVALQTIQFFCAPVELRKLHVALVDSFHEGLRMCKLDLKNKAFI